MNRFQTKVVSFVLFSILTAAASVPTAQAADDSRLFAFKFSTNQPLYYAVSIKSRMILDNSFAGKSSLIKNSTELRYKMRLTSFRKNADGTTTVLFKPYQVEQDTDSVGPNHIVTETRDLNIRSLQNGIVIIDTGADVGVAQAKPLKLGVYPMLLSGFINFDPTGAARKFEGDLPFIDHWTETLKEDIGFFHICFPNHPVAVRDTWTQSFALNSSGGVTLADPLMNTNTYTREPDLVTNGNPVAAFSMTSASHLQNLNGYFEQKGQKSSLNISQLDHNAFGTYHFDPARGILLDAKSSDTGDINLDMLVQGNSVTSHVDVQTEVEMNLITGPPAKQGN